MLRQEHNAGEKLFVDWAGTAIPIHDPRGNPAQQAHLFVAVLGASSYTYAEATPDEPLASWIGAHVRAFEFYQGVPKLVVPDNTKTGVTKACRYDPGLNPTYQEMAMHYGIGVVPGREDTAMLKQPIIQKLGAMRLLGMAEALKAQEQDPSARELSFLERFGLLVDQQWNWREHQALARRLKNAKLRTPNGCVEKIDYRTARGLDKSVIRSSTQQSAWVGTHENIFVLARPAWAMRWRGPMAVCVRSTILTSQLPVARWHEQIGDPTLADGILDRFVYNAHRIETRGDSMRKNRGKTNT